MKIYRLGFIVLLCATAAHSELPLPPTLHDPQTAICEMNRIANALGTRDMSALAEKLEIYSEDFGRVSKDTPSKFFEGLNASDRSARNLPLTVRSVGLLVPNSTNPVYVVDLHKGRWGGGSIWLVWFHSNEIVKLKEAPELYSVAARNDAFGSINACEEVANG